MKVPGHPRICMDPEICGGRATVAGTRMRVTDVLQMLAEGVSQAEVLADFPYLNAEDLRACLLYGAAAVDEQVDPGSGPGRRGRED